MGFDGLPAAAVGHKPVHRHSLPTAAAEDDEKPASGALSDRRRRRFLEKTYTSAAPALLRIASSAAIVVSQDEITADDERTDDRTDVHMYWPHARCILTGALSLGLFNDSALSVPLTLSFSLCVSSLSFCLLFTHRPKHEENQSHATVLLSQRRLYFMLR